MKTWAVRKRDGSWRVLVNDIATTVKYDSWRQAYNVAYNLAKVFG